MPHIPAYSIAGVELSGYVTELPIPDHATALSKARQEAAASTRELNLSQLARRAEEIIAERRRCVVVPAGAVEAMLKAGISIQMN